MQKPRLTFSLLLLGMLATAAAQARPAASQFPPHTLPNTQLRVLPPTDAGRQYQLHVLLPESYERAPDRRYPVLFVTDGYWDFPTMVATYNNLAWDRVVPEMIIVGLGYAGENLDYNVMRRWELTPVPLGNDAASGHASEFLATIQKTIIPFVDREYRTDPSYRVLAGCSLGGLFTLYAMYTDPTLFQAYIAVSPAVSVQNSWLLGYEDSFVKAGKSLQARLYLTEAEWEWPSFKAAIEAYRDRVRDRKQSGLIMEYRMVEAERHSGTKAESYTRGLQFAFAPLAPQTGPISDDWQH
jgi:predicted alpha/beta superfamily hydrolase